MESNINNQLQYLISLSNVPQIQTTLKKTKYKKEVYIALGICALGGALWFVAYKNALKSVMKRIKRDNEYC